MEINLYYSLAGVLVGLVVGLTGVGGGSLMTPLLVLVFGFHPVTAVGTDLLYASATKAVGTSVHGWRGTVDWKIVRRLALGSVPATLVTLAILSYAARDRVDTGHAIAVILGITLILTATATIFRTRILVWLRPRFEAVSEGRLALLTVLLGVALGAMVSLTSVGAGALGMTALIVLYPDLPIRKLVGSDIAHAVPLTLLGGLGHLALGTVDLPLLVSLLIGSVPGIIVGSMVASRVPDRVLGPILAGVLAIVGIRLLY